MRMIRPGSALLSAALVFLSCSDPSAPRTPTSISVVSGADQSGQVTEALAQPVVVEVRDADGRPVGGTSVTWTVTAGGGSVNAATSSTNGSGRAQAMWTLGSEAGVNRLSAGVTGVAPTSITATAHGAAPASATVTAGEDQIGLEMQPLGDAIVVQVLDEFGNGVPDANVTFTPGAGVVTPRVVATDGSGIAAAIWTLGPAGQQSVAITTEGLAQDPLEVTATALAASDVTMLQNGTPRSGISATKGENRYYRVTVPANVTSLSVSTTGGPGDADLYVRRGQLPTTTMSDCDSTSPSTTESCTVDLPASGTWYVLLDAWSTYADVTINATYIIGGTMVVNVAGLPQGAAADLVIRGADNYEKRITATTTLSALVPGDYEVTASYVRHDNAVYVSSPEEQHVTVELGAAANVSVTYAQAAGALNLDIVGAYITQSVQRPDGSIPLVAGRDGLLRVFARGNAASTEMPAVRARFYRNGTLVQTMTIPAPSATLPVSHDERSLTSTWNVQVPGSLLQPGTDLLVDVDPANEVVEADESDNSFPASGTPAGLDVRTAQPLLARLVPVVQANGQQGDVTAANRDTYVTDAQALYPLPSIDVDVRAPYSFDGTLSSSYDSTWQRLLREINALRLAEAPERYYYGVIKPSYTSGGTGLGYIRQPAAIGVDWAPYRAGTVAHEWGHNFGRFHVDCGGPASPDPDYPYATGRLGHHGYDIRTNEILELETHFDLMSYCRPTWASDYTYEAVMAYRAPQTGVTAGAAGAQGARNGAAPSLLVWGHISPDGAVLEPSFEVVAAPSRPHGNGAYRLTGRDESGATVLDVSFDAYEIDHMPGVRTFAWTIPLSEMGGRAPAELQLRGSGVNEVRRQMAATGTRADVQLVREGSDRVRVQWNAARNPVLMIRDARNGEILSFVRGGDAHVTLTAAEVDINMSNGVKSTMRRFVVPR